MLSLCHKALAENKGKDTEAASIQVALKELAQQLATHLQERLFLSHPHLRESALCGVDGMRNPGGSKKEAAYEGGSKRTVNCSLKWRKQTQKAQVTSLLSHKFSSSGCWGSWTAYLPYLQFPHPQTQATWCGRCSEGHISPEQAEKHLPVFFGMIQPTVAVVLALCEGLVAISRWFAVSGRCV